MHHLTAARGHLRLSVRHSAGGSERGETWEGKEESVEGEDEGKGKEKGES